MTIIPNQELVIIKPESVAEVSEGGIIMPELVKENKSKLQNRGEIVALGSKVEFWQVGDFTSFYRNAATPIVENGVEYLSIHHSHILCKFV